MNFMRQHWYQVGLFIAIIFGIVLAIFHDSFSGLQLLLSISLITLSLHQFEEYQFPGYFPRMMNTVMFKSEAPDRYPLNTNTSLIINTGLGWLLYILAIVFADQAVWLAIASILVSCGNIVAHTILFNIKGKTFYNPGMATALVLFLPLSIYFFVYLSQHDLLHTDSFIIGLVLGIFINFCILRMITLLARKDTPYYFAPLH